MVANCSILCPALTVVTHDGAHFTCSYTEWAYGLAAALICVGGLLPIALLICFWVKLKNSAVKRKGKFRRQDSEASTFTDVSRPHDHGVYEVLRDDENQDILFRTRKGVFPHHRYGTFSVPDLKKLEQDTSDYCAGLYPNLTQVHPPDSCHTTPSLNEKKSCQAHQYPSDEVVPKRLARKRPRRQHSHNTDDTNVAVDPKSVKFARRGRRISRNALKTLVKSSLVGSKSPTTERKMSNSTSSSTDGLTLDRDSSTPIIVPCLSRSLSWTSLNDSGKKAETTKCLSFLPTPPVRHLAEGVDFDLYLRDCVGKLPEDQRNGTFLIRDSQSRIGCKVLVVYYKGLDPSNVLYHYKLCFTEEHEIYLQGSIKVFPTVDDMISEFRTSKTILPCLLSNCLGKNF